MWQCVKCREKLEDSFDICWSCGTSKDGVEDLAGNVSFQSPVGADDRENLNQGVRPHWGRCEAAFSGGSAECDPLGWPAQSQVLDASQVVAENALCCVECYAAGTTAIKARRWRRNYSAIPHFRDSGLGWLISMGK